MNFFIDSEFQERGPDEPIELISLAIVAESGDELYLVNDDFYWDSATPWIKQNVRPNISEGNPQRLPHENLGSVIETYVLRNTPNDRPYFWGYYCDYDWVGLSQCFGRMVDLPKNFPMFCLDLKQLMVMYQIEKEMLPTQAENEHNALFDARWIRDAWREVVRRVECDEARDPLQFLRGIPQH